MPASDSSVEDEFWTWERDLAAEEARAAAEMREEEANALARWLFEASGVLEEEEEEEEASEPEEQEVSSSSVDDADDADDDTSQVGLAPTQVDDETEEEKEEQEEEEQLLPSALSCGQNPRG